jgi:3-oxoacyl-[acyl-carrier-protein] synthase II
MDRVEPKVVITGMGAITPVGYTLADIWDSLKAGRSGIVRITAMDTSEWGCHLGGELQGFDPQEFLSRSKLRHMPFTSQMAVIAARQAVEDADLILEDVNRDRVGVVIGTAGTCTIEETEAAYKKMIEAGRTRATPIQAVRLWPNMISFFVSESFDVHGYSSTICTACASSTQALGEAAEVIRRGDADVVISGGSDSGITRVAYSGFDAMSAFPQSYNDNPAQASRPFDAKREGFVPSQGCGILVLESLEHARQRGATILAEVMGLGASNDAFHVIAPEPSGRAAALAIERALANSGIAKDEVDYINAHGTGTPLGDVAETNAIKIVFGERAHQIPISSTKSMVGHLMGAAGAVEAIACVKSIQEGIIHPTINYEFPDPECDLDYVPNEARAADVRIVLSNSFGLGGQNACLVLGAV